MLYFVWDGVALYSKGYKNKRRPKRPKKKIPDTKRIAQRVSRLEVGRREVKRGSSGGERDQSLGLHFTADRGLKLNQ